MIRASDILEAMARFDDPLEKAKTLYKILDSLGATMNRFLDSNQFLYLKRLVPDSVYSGKGYRFIGLSHKESIKLGVYDDERSAEKQEPPDISRLISYFKSHMRGRYQSWAKSLEGINSEMSKQAFEDWTLGHGNFYLFTSQISGIDLGACASALREIVDDLEIPDVEKQRHFSSTRLDFFVKDYGSSEEVLAPMPSIVDLYGVFSVDDLKHVRDVRKIRVTGADVYDADIDGELEDALKNGEMARTHELIELGASCDDILRRALEGGAGYDMFQDIIYSDEFHDFYGDCGGGDTPLMVAVKEIDLQMMDYLNYSKRDMDDQNDNGETALHLAVEYGFLEGVEFLLKHGVDTNVVTHKGKTALSIAIENLSNPGQEEIIGKLLDAGADPKINPPGKTLIGLVQKFASMSAEERIQDLLIRAGAKE